MRVTRYFAIHPACIDNYRGLFVPEGDFLAIAENINCKVLANLDDGRVVVHVLFGQQILDYFKDITETDDPFSKDALEALGLSDSYLGSTSEEVRRNTGQDFTKTISYEDPETGETVEKTIDLLNHEWR